LNKLKQKLFLAFGVGYVTLASVAIWFATIGIRKEEE
jgi:hypothetical protein